MDAYGIEAAYPEYGVQTDLVVAPDETEPAASEAPEPGPPEHRSLIVDGPPVNDVYAAPHPSPPPLDRGPMQGGGMPMHAQATGAYERPSGAMLGVIVIGLGAAAYAGHRYGGWPGVGAAVLGVGSAFNGLRAIQRYRSGDPADKKEARVSAIYSLVGGAAGGFVWHRYARNYTPNPPRRPSSSSRSRTAPFGDCDIRPVGP